MNRLNRRFLACVFLVFPILLIGQNPYLDKKVTIQNGHFTLKNALKTISDQTGCVFSYDPTKVNDKQQITVSSKSTVTLRLVLQKILPKNIQFKMNGKYVVLQKIAFTNGSATKSVTSQNKAVIATLTIEKSPNIPTILIEKHTADSSISKVDSVVKPVIIITEHRDSLKADIIPLQHNIVKENIITNNQLLSTPKSDTIKIVKSKPNSLKNIVAFGFAADNHLGTVFTQIGSHNLYGILLLGSDYYKSYHLGIGVGLNLKLYKHLGINVDLIQYALAAGRSRKLNIRAYTTQISPELNYLFGKRLKIFAGPSAYVIKSSYKKGTTTSDLGQFVGFSGIAGIAFNFSAN